MSIERDPHIDTEPGARAVPDDGRLRPGLSARGGHRQWLVARASALPRLDLLLTVALIGCSLAVTLPRLGTPSRYFFDEILYASTAREYVRGNPAAQRWDGPCAVGRDDAGCLAANPAAQVGNRVGKIEWTHPPLSKELIAAGIAVGGDSPLGRRLPSALAGALGVGLLFRFGLLVTRQRAVAFLAAGFLALDGLWFVQSRLALPDIFLAVAVLGAMAAFAAYLRAPPSAQLPPLLITGALLGLGLATKWSAAFVWGLICLVVLVRWLWLQWPGGRAGPDPKGTAGRWRMLAGAGVALVALPITIYVLAHLRFFVAGHGAGEFVELHVLRLAYHQSYAAEFDYGSRWWQWPLALRPAWYGATTMADGRVANIYANGNPLLFWGFLPALAWLSWRWRRRSELLVVAIGFLGAWLPWALVERATLVYAFLPAVPFGCLAVAVAVGDLFRADTGWRRTLAVEYVVAVALAFAFFYPFYAFVGLNPHDIELRLWLPDWR